MAEICSGEAVLTRCLRFGRELRAVAMDVLDWEPYRINRGYPKDCTSTTPLDLTCAAGFASLSKKWNPFI